ncbi:hypothetical protein GON01_16445 [Sphingomonas sp. MAH-20]|jgi:hypothetical protein|uniref:Uncharacterized protein n=1 Tax=Sphingomonas horti TaxID=2682842 RepID=A0A6I4J5X0_9SPHN|nr:MULTISPECIES: hypothetical protein [Sphingomonas]MBA2921010.1 hypothetical protein [Sphingomonas sp. CGMCC 1.13658]MVO79523.1 hypothetical protein [Sphingomonas horti]
MTENDYVLSLLAIVSGLAITHMIASLYELLSNRREVRLSWLALLAAGYTAYLVLYGWWVTWAGFHARSGTLPFWRFLMPMLSVTCLALAARASLPSFVPEGGLDLAERYSRHGVWIWRALLASAGISMLGVLVRKLSGEAMSDNATPWGLAGLALMLSMLAVLSLTRVRVIHAVLVPMSFGLLVAATLAHPV